MVLTHMILIVLLFLSWVHDGAYSYDSNCSSLSVMGS